MRSQALRADLLMLITAAIWGAAFVAQSVGMQAIGPFLFSGLRFALGALLLVPLLLWQAMIAGKSEP
ncbi:MAG TPA: EamA family transporter, partial [Pseudomonas sp.]|nr:EamA family transporter [Pseudomonas sp.]